MPASQAKIVLVLLSGLKRGGRASEAWWVPYTDNPAGLRALLATQRNLATTRAAMCGGGAGVAAIRTSLYDPQFIRTTVLPVDTNNGSGWNSVFIRNDVAQDSQNRINNLSIATGRTAGVGVRYVFTGGRASYSSFAFPPQGISMEKYVDIQTELNTQFTAGGNPNAQSPFVKWTTAVNAYRAALLDARAYRRVRAPYTPQVPIVGGLSGTPTALARVFIRNADAANFTPGQYVHIGGRRSRPGFSARRQRDLGGDRIIANLIPDSPVVGQTALEIVCTLNVAYEQCRRPGFVSPISSTTLALTGFVVGDSFKPHRNNHALTSVIGGGA